MIHRRLARAAVLSSLALLALAHCSTAPTCADGARCNLDGGRTDGTVHGNDGGDGAVSLPTDLTAIAIDPVNPTLTSTNGAMVTQAFRLVGTHADGTQSTVAGGAWSLDSTSLGTVSGDGVFTANGIAGGTVVLRATGTGAAGATLTASTNVTVRIVRLVAGGPADGAARFAAATMGSDAAQSVQLLYPLEGAVMPNNVAPPDVQWQGGVAGDLYRIQITRPDVAITAYVTHSGAAFGYDDAVDHDAWRSLAESDPGMTATLTVDRLATASMTVYPGTPRHFVLGHGGTFGAVYYWDLDLGRIQRINAVTAARESFMPNPPNSPSGGRRCVACHAVSADGRYLGGQLGEGGDRRGTVFDLTADLTPDPAPSVFATTVATWGPSSFNPDSTRLVVSSLPGLGMIDPLTGASVAATGLPTTNANHPAWSPDGQSIAYVATDQPFAWAFAHGDLMLLPRTAGDAFGAAQMLHAGATLSSQAEGGMADSHPTWSPDSNYLAFAHIHESADGTAPDAGALYLVSRAGGTAVRLNTAMGGAAESHSMYPTFSPFETNEGEAHAYYWLAFYSRRDYGNTQVGTRGTNRRQLWVTAIDAPTGAGDASHVPYWLPGQDTAQDNIAAYWAPLACRPNGADCSLSSECCSDSCLPDPAMPSHTICAPPPTSMCRGEGATCSASSECCSGLTCYGHVCVRPPG